MTLRETKASEMIKSSIDKTIKNLYRQAKSSSWIERENGGFGLRNLLSSHFDEVYPICRKWAEDENPYIRRAAALSCRQLKSNFDSGRIKDVLIIAEPLLTDSTLYVKKNLGPYALGHLMYYFPKETIPFLKKWMKCQHEQVLWNVAMTFQQAAGRKHADVAIPILKRLGHDPRKYVWRAVASSMLNISRGCPSETIPILEGWLRNKDLKRPAEIVFKYLK